VKNDKIFLEVLKKLNEAGLLNELILIGGWCLYVYKEYFNDSEQVPIKRTSDLDLLIPNPPKLKHTVNITALLKELDFRVEHNFITNFSKFVHPDLEIEFLMNQKGRGDTNVCEIKSLSVTAVQLRYLSLLESNAIKVDYQGLSICIPEPAAFTLHKYIISDRRKNLAKSKKDLETAKEMTDFLLTIDKQKKKFKSIFKDISAGWRKTLLAILKEEHQELYDFLKRISV
jgi:hypothetical protein